MGLISKLFAGVTGALSGGVGTALLGGIADQVMSRSNYNYERSKKLEDDAMHFVRLRAAAERAGYNPAAVLGMGPQNASPTHGSSPLGRAFSDAALMQADKLSAKQVAVENALAENQQLKEKLTAATLNPVRAGVYDGGQAYGLKGSSYVGNSGAAGSPLPVMVDVQASDGTIHQGPNPDGADADQAIWTIAQDYYYTDVKPHMEHQARLRLARIRAGITKARRFPNGQASFSPDHEHQARMRAGPVIEVPLIGQPRAQTDIGPDLPWNYHLRKGMPRFQLGVKTHD